MPISHQYQTHAVGHADDRSGLVLVCTESAAAAILPDALQSLPEIAWCASADGATLAANARWHALTGMADGPFALADWVAAMHVDDRPGLTDDWVASIAAGTPLDAAVRYRCADGNFAWMQVRMAPVHDSVGAIGHWVGVGSGIDRLKASEARAALIADELAHRVGNIFAVVGGMLALSARAQPEAADFARATAARIAALATAHAFIWPPGQDGNAAPQSAGTLIDLLLRPYSTPDGPKIDVVGNGAVITGVVATCVTLIVHELATNAAKHGALSGRAGHLTVRLRATRTHLTVIWSEQGGPAIPHPPARSGFGTGLIDRVARLGQVAQMRRWWRPTGLIMVLRLAL